MICFVLLFFHFSVPFPSLPYFIGFILMRGQVGSNSMSSQIQIQLEGKGFGIGGVSSDWLGLSHVPFLQPITVARVVACSHWPGISHMLESGVVSALPEAWRPRVGEGCLLVPKIRMLTFMEVSLSGCRASETTVYFSDWSI